MGRTTLTDWLFSWLANFKIDFRQQCTYCGENPEMLACDGTMLGLFFRNSSFVPIEKPSCLETVNSLHRRTERQFFCYEKNLSANKKKEIKLAREDLKYFLSRNSRTLNGEELHNPVRTDETRKAHIVTNIPHDCSTVIQNYVDCTYSQDTIIALSEIFKVLVTEKPVSSLLNPRFVDPLLNVLNLIEKNEEFSLLTMVNDLPEICFLIEVAKKNKELLTIVVFLRSLAERVEAIHSNDGVLLKPGNVGYYNPEVSGRAYYFTRHGQQLRDIPKYLDKDEKEDTSTSCKKKSYATSSKSGTTYLFLMFDPRHYGHCYGFHLIENEGPKDAFCPPFMYMDQAPKEVFYDNSCKLEEYCLNREPKFWSETRFWHDIFHGYSHKCPYSYNSRRIPKLSRVNSEICEQFNSFIQKIKYSGRAMSQSHFIFFLQFFIHLWNEKKKSKFEKQRALIQSFQQ